MYGNRSWEILEYYVGTPSIYIYCIYSYVSCVPNTHTVPTYTGAGTKNRRRNLDPSHRNNR